LKTTLPYLFGSALGLDANFDLYRRDSSYIDIMAEVGGQFLTEGGNYWKAYSKNIVTNVLFYDTLRIKLSRRLPNMVDSRINNLGIEYFYQQLDNRFCPSKGIELKINCSLGRKTIRKNAAISSLRDLQGEKMDYLYDSINLNSFQAQTQATASFFIPLGKNFCVHLRGQAAYLYSSGLIFQQELFRMGGQQTFRGFDEESLLATNYALATVETRFLLGGNSFLFLFGEGGTVGNFSRVAQTQNYLYSFGGGLALDTKAGVFAVGYGLGTYTDQPLIVSNGKIYFGYLNRF
jgi:Omp85 superfamily domain